ncbi:MAG: ABC transporter ATP-binding protein [Selenomonadaceae bacterium]|nr:ABC transporter ATP-binding protein [Selenomonadaceae bacterium]
MSNIIIRGLSKTFSVTNGIEHAAINDLQLTIVPGSFNVIVGKSGCGKTTLLRIIAGLEKSDRGEIENLPPRKKCSLMFQSPRFLPWLTIWENITFWEHGHFSPAEIAEAKEKAKSLLDTFGLTEWQSSFPGQLSGGMAQRASLVRTLATSPQLLLLDEPFAAVDYFTRLRLQDEVMNLWKAQPESSPLTVIFVTHDIGEASRLATHIHIMAQGCITATLQNDAPYPRPLAADRSRLESAILSALNAVNQ